MILEYGDMWSVWPATDLFLITANSFVKRTGQLVMGAGIARQARDRFPGLDLTLGQAIRETCGHLGEYGLLISPRWPAARLGLFQVKCHWSTEALPELIRRSTEKLTVWANAHPDCRIDLNFPGIGNGRLHPAQVLPIVGQLPDNVHVWRYRQSDVDRSSQTPGREARRVGRGTTVQQALHNLRVDLIYHSEALEGSPLTRSEIEACTEPCPGLSG